MPGRFSLRQRFELAPGGRLPFDQPTVVLFQDGQVSVELRSLEERPLSESSLMAIWGSGYESEAAARVAGEQWRSGMQKALAGVNLGANFGLRNPRMGGFTDAVLEEITREMGSPVYRESWNVQVFPSDPRPLFSFPSATGEIRSSGSVVLASVAACLSDQPVDEIAFNLYTASMRSGHMADVRVVLLVMALECLIERRRRPPCLGRRTAGGRAAARPAPAPTPGRCRSAGSETRSSGSS